MFAWDSLPVWIAALNLASAALLIAGFLFIRSGRVTAHKRCMLAAFSTSLLFLAVYLLHHWRVGVVYFRGLGWHRTVYLWTLGTHTPLAAVVPFLALITLSLAVGGNFARHKKWARWTLPIWLYVSVTGVLVYWMLYRW